MKVKYDVLRLFLVFIFFLFVNKLVADTTTIKFIGVKPKSADTVHYVNIFTKYLWDVDLYKNGKKIHHFAGCSPDTLSAIENADKIILTKTFNVDSSLLGKTYVLSYKTTATLSIKINGAERLKIKRPFRIKRFTLFKESKKGDIYFTYPASRVTFEISLVSADLNTDFTDDFIISELARKDTKNEEKSTDEKTDFALLFFYLAIGIVLLIQFMYYKLRIENFYFSLFCIFVSFSFLKDFFGLSSFAENLCCFGVLSLDLLAQYLSIVLTEKKRTQVPLYIFLSILGIYFLLQAFFPYDSYEIIMDIAQVVYFIYSGFICIYLLFQGGTKRKWEVKYISYGFLMTLFMLIFFAVFVIFTSENASHDEGYQAIYNYSTCVALLIVPITIGVIVGKRNGLNQRELANQLVEIEKLSNENLKKEKEKQVILENQNIVLEEKVIERTKEVVQQKEIVEQKNREILDSIEYALCIQTTILPPQKLVKQYLEDSFILYRPKDIVAGDFYWMEAAPNLPPKGGKVLGPGSPTLEELEGAILFAACDCTGHGVPGAMVSVVCHNALNKAVKEFGFRKPSEILDKTAEIVIENFSKSEEEIKDGMDIALCLYNPASMVLEYSGANNPLWIIRRRMDGENSTAGLDFIEIRADKQPIGMSEDNHPFTNHEIKLNRGDIIYIFSDGYADQFSPGDKKLMKNKFKDLLLSISHLSMTQQKDSLDSFIEDWKGTMEQTDDILVIGVRV